MEGIRARGTPFHHCCSSERVNADWASMHNKYSYKSALITELVNASISGISACLPARLEMKNEFCVCLICLCLASSLHTPSGLLFLFILTFTIRLVIINLISTMEVKEGWHFLDGFTAFLGENLPVTQCNGAKGNLIGVDQFFKNRLFKEGRSILKLD